MSKQQRAQMYKDFLSEEGYAPKLDEDGDVAFKCEGLNYLILIDEDDDEYFHLVFPGFWPIESEAEREQVLQAAAQATANTKVAKVFPVRDTTWAAIEMFCDPPESFKPVFRRSMSALRAGVQSFVDKMRE